MNKKIGDGYGSPAHIAIDMTLYRAFKFNEPSNAAKTFFTVFIESDYQDTVICGVYLSHDDGGMFALLSRGSSRL